MLLSFYSGGNSRGLITASHPVAQRAKEAALKRQGGDEGSAGKGGGGGFLDMKGELLSNRGALEASAVAMADFLAALTKVSKSVGAGDLEKYQKWVDEFGSA